MYKTPETIYFSDDELWAVRGLDPEPVEGLPAAIAAQRADVAGRLCRAAISEFDTVRDEYRQLAAEADPVVSYELIRTVVDEKRAAAAALNKQLWDVRQEQARAAARSHLRIV